MHLSSPLKVCEFHTVMRFMRLYIYIYMEEEEEDEDQEDDDGNEHTFLL